jgi:hypothetical protein
VVGEEAGQGGNPPLAPLVEHPRRLPVPEGKLSPEAVEVIPCYRAGLTASFFFAASPVNT